MLYYWCDRCEVLTKEIWLNILEYQCDLAIWLCWNCRNKIEEEKFYLTVEEMIWELRNTEWGENKKWIK